MPKIATCKNQEERDVLFDFLSTGAYPVGYTKDQKKNLKRKAGKFLIVSGSICFIGKGRQPLKAIFEYETEAIADILKREHEVAHLGMKKMASDLKKKYYGIPNEMICNYVRACQSCAHFNSLKTIQPLYINDITSKYDRYMMDCVDLRRYSDQNDGLSWILNVIDTYTKYLWSFRLREKTAVAIKDSLVFIFNNFGVPKSIQSDNGKEFKNNLVREFLESQNILVIHGRPRNPKAQGQVERVNQTIKRLLAKKLYGTNSCRWIDHHEAVVHAYNRADHRATSKSPFFLFHGHQGFNSSLVGGFATDTAAGLQMSVIEENDEEPSNQEWTFNENPEDVALKTEVATHFQKYKAKIIENKDSNLQASTISLGDRVMIKKDFDANTKTKKLPFDSFYENADYVTVALLNNNMVTIEDQKSKEKRNVFKGIIKKI